MGVEAALGTTENFHPFIASVRPHRGQIEVAENICVFLKGSKFATARGSSGFPGGETKLNRHAVRTSSQWFGPVLEELGLARQQIEIELSSPTDNLLVDITNS